MQTVPFRGSTTPVGALPEFGYVLQWSDGSTENPRVLTDVTASQTQTASFRVSSPVPASGKDPADSLPPGRGLDGWLGWAATEPGGHPDRGPLADRATRLIQGDT